MLTDLVAGGEIPEQRLLWHKVDYAQERRTSHMLLALLGICVGALLLALPLGAASIAGMVDGFTVLALVATAGQAWRYWRVRHAGRFTAPVPAAQPTRGWQTSSQLVAPVTMVLVGVALGLQYGARSADQQLLLRVPVCADARFEELDLTVLSRPVRIGLDLPPERRGVRFEAQVDAQASPSDCAALPGRRLRLSWYGAPDVVRGQRWRVRARVRPPWSYRNPGGFDYERWLLGQRLHGTGYVRDGQLRSSVATVRADDFGDWLHERRVQHRGIILALARGDDSAISTAEWDALRRSGTVHLVVVSGLHVGMVAGLLFLLVRLLVQAFPQLLLWCEAQRVASAVSIVGTGVFVLLSGSGVPALRAWFMASVALVAVSVGERLSLAVVYLLALGVILLLEPLVVHQQGFWLSFAAVALLLGFFGARPGLNEGLKRGLKARLTGTLRGLLYTQWVLLLGLAPLLALQQQEIPSAVVLANLFVVPLVSLGVLPLALLLVLCWQHSEAMASALLAVLQPLLALVVGIIDMASRLPLVAAGSHQALPFLAALLAGHIVLSLNGWRWRMLALLAWGGWLAPAPLAVPPGEFRLLALDVGQGSALSVDTRHHRLVFDVGPRYPGGFDLGAVVVVPSLIATGPLSADTLVLSHSDIDHTGGTQALLGRVRPRALYTSFPNSFSAASGHPPVHKCRADVKWRWDGVTFEFLNPDVATDQSDNDRSCVLLISTPTRRVLLAGDISSAAERRLLSAHTRPLDVDLLMAPHHGSNGSSSARWIQATTPEMVFISAPRRSRYGHPHPAVIARYRAAGARVWVTGTSGALEWRSWDPALVGQARLDGAPYWINQPGTMAPGSSSR